MIAPQSWRQRLWQLAGEPKNLHLLFLSSARKKGAQS